jgi:hypothetical protein
MSRAKQVALDISKVAAKAVVSGAIAGGVSWAVLGRKDVVDFYGIEMKHAVADFCLVALSSLTGDIIGYYALPWLEEKMFKSAGAKDWLRMLAPPAITGIVYYGAKKYTISPEQEQEMAKDVLLGLGAKWSGDKLVDKFYDSR